MAEKIMTYRGAVYPWHCDHIGHMNVMWYIGKFDEATWHLFSKIGITSSYLRKEKCGMAAVQQNTSYKQELRAGDIITIYSGILEINKKVIRFFHEMKNQETGNIAAVTILTGVHIDTDTRVSCEFPKEIIACGKEMIMEYKGDAR